MLEDWLLLISTGKCHETNQPYYNVKKGVAIYIDFSLDKLVKFSKFKIDLAGYEKITASDIPDFLGYKNKKVGVNYDTSFGNLNNISFFPVENFPKFKACEN